MPGSRPQPLLRERDHVLRAVPDECGAPLTGLPEGWSAILMMRRLIGRRPPGAVALAVFALGLCCPSNGSAFPSPLGIAVEASGDVLVTDSVQARLFRLDPVTADRLIVSGLEVGAGPAFVRPVRVAVEASGDLVLTDSGLVALVRVDPITGNRTILSDSGTGAGPLLANPAGVDVEASGDLVVVDNDLRSVVRVDPLTGDRAIVSGTGTGAGPALSNPIGLAVEPSGTFVVTDHDLGVVRVDPLTGDRTIASGTGVGIGPAFALAHDIAVEASGELVVVDAGTSIDAVVRVDPVTGDRSTASGDLIGAGPNFGAPVSIAVEASGALLVGANLVQLQAILRVDPPTGDRTKLAIDCPPAPRPVCTTGFGKAKLSIVERRPGGEKLTMKLVKGPELFQSDFGDPTGAEVSAFALCVYDDANTLAGNLIVDRALEICGGKPCWRSLGGAPPVGKGYLYKDTTGHIASGVSKLLLKGGPAGRSKLTVRASNTPSRPFSSLPTGIAAALVATTSVRMQVISDEGACFEATLTDISKQESDIFAAK